MATVAASAGVRVGAPVLPDNPEAYIAGDRRRAIADGRQLPEHVRGAGVFADISGFTPLTEALATELGPQRGAEELTAVLDVVFSAVLGELLRFGGTVIYFSGDAVTCWVDGDNGTRAVACALAMQTALDKVGTVTTPGGASVTLRLKVAVSVGRARRFVVGDPRIQLIDVLAGSLMDTLAATEHFAEPGDVVVDEHTAAALGDAVALVPVGEPGGATAARAIALLQPIAAPPPAPRSAPLPDSVVRQWLLPPVWQRLKDGRGDFLAELRHAVPLFLRFGGLDFDDDDDAPKRLDEFVRRAQHVVDERGGNVLQLTLGDKGAYLYAVFGSPIAHEDDAARACAAAVELRALEGTANVRDLQIGVASGRLRSGTYGHMQRRTFCCLGDAVNLAARLMSNAASGEILVTAEVARAAAGVVVTGSRPPLKVKGKAEPVAVCSVDGIGVLRRSRERAVAGTAPLFGRSVELATLAAAAARARSGQGSALTVIGDAGLGKSALVAAFTSRLRDEGWTVLTGDASSLGAATAYLAWRPLLRGLLGLPDDDTDPRAALRAAIRAIDPTLEPRLPLLGTVLGIAIEDTPLTRSFDAKLRKASLEQMLLTIIEAAARRLGPLLLLVEDGHWLDQLSRDLIQVAARTLADLPLLLVVTQRPDTPDIAGEALLLDRLDAPSCRALLADRAQALYPDTVRVADAVADRVLDHADGNPFHLEELIGYLHGRKVDVSDHAVAGTVELPASLSSLVLGRIDVLPEGPRRTLKVASVVGRDFRTRTLASAYPDLGRARTVRDRLHTLSRRQLVVHTAPRTDAWAFRHASIREVAYESMPFAIRAALHTQVGRWFESVDPSQVDLLAHHFGRSDDLDRKRTYLLLAGRAAQDRYANADAVVYLRDAVPLVPVEERAEVLLRLGAVLELTGDWAGAELTYEEALAVAAETGVATDTGRAHAASADCLRKQGRFDDAERHIAEAAAAFRSVGDEAGLARVAHVRGTLFAQRGDNKRARSSYLEGVEIRRQLGDTAGLAALISNLAIVAEYEGDFDEAQSLNEQSLALRVEVGDPQPIAVSRNNMCMVAGLRMDFASAVEHGTNALRLAREVGDVWLAAMASNNLANAHRELGNVDSAKAHYKECLRSFEMLGDPWMLAIMYDDIALLAAAIGRASAALTLAAAAEERHAELGSPRAPAAEALLEERLTRAAERLGDQGRSAREQGRSLDPRATHELAEALCAT